MQPPRKADPLVGSLIAHFRVESRLGSGGMGVVYKATDMRLGRTVALKVLPSDLGEDEGRRERLLTEARAASALDHPNIGTIHDLSELEDGQPLIVMAYYEGETLSHMLARGPLSLTRALDLAIQTARGLAAAHARGIIHRDIKPSNLVVTPEGALKILDFGLARISGETRVTKPGTVMGTASYVSPEQAGGREADERSDVWSLGVVLYEMVAGRVPFPGDSAPSVLYAIVHQAPAGLEQLPGPVQDLIDQALAKNPAERFANGGELLVALQELRSRLGFESQEQTQPITVARKEEKPSQWRRSAVSPPATVKAGRRARLIWAATLAGLCLAAWLLAPKLRQRLGLLPEEKSVAVLPFTIVGAAEGGAALADGLLETLTSRLTEQERNNASLWVVPSSEIRRKNLMSAEEAQKALGANLVVTGSVQRMGSAIRLTMNLVNAKTLRQVGSAVLDEPDGDYLRLQDQALAKLSDLLAFKMEGTQTRAEIVPAKQYEKYLRGVGLLVRWDKGTNLSEAAGLLENVAAQTPQFAPGRVALANAYWLKNLRDRDPVWMLKAKEQLQAAQKLDDRLAGLHETLGKIYNATGSRDLAVLEFQEALKIDPRSAAALAGVARSLETLGRLEEAEETYKKMIAVRPREWNGHNNLGSFYFRQKKFVEAETQFRKVIELTPDNWAAYSNLGNALKRQGKSREALDAFDKANAISPNYVTYQNAGTLAFEEGNFRRAAELFEQALKLNDKDYRVWGSVASALIESKGDKEQIQRHLRRAVELAEAAVKTAPQDVEARSYLATYYADLGEPGKARETVQSLAAQAPNDGEVWGRMGEVWETLGERQEAEKAVEVALSKGVSATALKRSPRLAKVVEQLERKGNRKG